MTQKDFIKKVCMFGPQGSGKGTQSKRISEDFGIPHLSTGDIFRKAISENTELGQQIQSILKEGKLVPSEVTNAVMKERLQREDCVDGFILDGYPRNLIQAEALDAVTALSHVIVIDIPDAESVHRLSRRRVCPGCSATYHLDYNAPKTESTCDVCGHELEQREDDQPEAIQQRLDIYHSETEPLIKRYEDRGIVFRIDGTQSIADVWKDVEKCFFVESTDAPTTSPTQS